MGFLLDVLAFLVFPGLLFAAVTGVLSAWAVRWLTALARRRRGPAWSDVASEALALGRQALRPARWELRATGAVLMAGLGAAAAASSLLWLAALAPQAIPTADLATLLLLLAISPLVALYASDWFSRNKGLGEGRDALLLTHGVILLLALLTPAVQARALTLSGVFAFQSVTGPAGISWAGGAAFAAAALALLAYLPLLGTLWAEGLALAKGATEALLLQVLRSASLFVLLAAVVFLFWSGPQSGALGFLLFWPKYAVALALLVAAREVLRAFRVERALAYAWVPAGPLALLALALAAGGM